MSDARLWLEPCLDFHDQPAAAYLAVIGHPRANQLRSGLALCGQQDGGALAARRRSNCIERRHGRRRRRRRPQSQHKTSCQYAPCCSRSVPRSRSALYAGARFGRFRGNFVRSRSSFRSLSGQCGVELGQRQPILVDTTTTLVNLWLLPGQFWPNPGQV